MSSIARPQRGRGMTTMTAQQVPQDFVVGVAGYRVNRNILLHRAIDRGIEPTARGVADFTGIYIGTARRMLSGGMVSAATMARVFRHLADPGEAVTALFSPVPDDEGR
jgi:hypothetical protein